MFARPIPSEDCPLHYCGDDVVLCVGVSVRVGPRAFCQLAFGSLVKPAIGLVSSEPVAKKKMPFDVARGVPKVYVYVLFGRSKHPVARFTDAKRVTGGFELREIPRFVLNQAYGNEDVDDRFGREPRNRSRADVLDAPRRLSQRSENAPALDLEAARPLLIVLRESNATRLERAYEPTRRVVRGSSSSRRTRSSRTGVPERRSMRSGSRATRRRGRCGASRRTRPALRRPKWRRCR